MNSVLPTANNYNESLYTNNKNVYKLLRYGVQVSQNPLFHNFSIPTFQLRRSPYVPIRFLVLSSLMIFPQTCSCVRSAHFTITSAYFVYKTNRGNI